MNEKTEILPCPLCGKMPKWHEKNWTCSSFGFEGHTIYGPNFDYSGDGWNAMVRRLKTPVPLAKKHTGMKVSIHGLISNSIADMKRGGTAYTLNEMRLNLIEMADRFYSGDLNAVDEFCQIYCLSGKRLKQEVADHE